MKPPSERVWGLVLAGGDGTRLQSLTRLIVVSRGERSPTMPTLVLVGRHDVFSPPSQAERLHRGIRGSGMVIFERSGHCPFVEEPEAFRDSVRDWLVRGSIPGLE